MTLPTPTRRGGISRRGFIASTAGFAFAPAILRAAGRPKLIFAMHDAVTQELVAESGAFKDAGFDLEWAVLSGPGQHISALYAGAIDVGYLGDTALLFEAANSAAAWDDAAPKLVNFAAWSFTYNSPHPTTVTAVRTDAGIEKPGDLRGKRFAVNFGGNAYVQYVATLVKAGLTPDDIETVQLPDVESTAAAFTRGDAEIWSGQYMNIRAAVEAGDARVFWDFDEVGIPNLGTLVATPQTLADPEKRAAIDEFLPGLGRYHRWLQDNPEPVIAGYKRVLKLDDDRAKFRWETNRWNYVPIDDALIAREQALADQFFDFGTLKRKVSAASVWDKQFQPLIFPV